MITPYFIFETERLAIRQYTPQDDVLLYSLSSNEDVMRYIRPVVNKTDSDKVLAQNIQLYLSKANTGRWAVFEKASRCYVGSFSILVMDTDPSKMHIGYALLPDFWGKGYASELLRRGITFFFASHADDNLYAITEEPNIASQKVLLKCGFTPNNTQMENEKKLLIYILRRA